MPYKELPWRERVMQELRFEEYIINPRKAQHTAVAWLCL